jgi:hypothetical protein
MACEGLGGMEALQEKEIEYEYVPLHMGAKLPKDTTGYAGTIILGGPMNTFIKRCSQKKRPCGESA